MTAQIHAITTEAQLRAVWPIVQQLRAHLDEHSFVAQALRQLDEGFHASALYVDGTPRAFAGWRVMEFLAIGKHMYIDDLVTDATTRSQGHGKLLLDWLKAEAKRLGCVHEEQKNRRARAGV